MSSPLQAAAPLAGSVAVPCCPSCGGGRLSPLYSLDRIPVQSCILLDSREEAIKFPRSALDLQFCADCGFIYNAAFDEKLVDYASTTEESQHFSDTFNTFARELVAQIGARHDLAGKLVLEVGCGKGDFLLYLIEHTGCRGLGVDPGYIPERLLAKGGEEIAFIRDYFDSSAIAEAPDFVVCRHTLEHIGPVATFVRDIAATFGKDRDVGIFFETPDMRRILEEGAFWDIYYEHCSYFTAGAHARLFEREGMRVDDVHLAYDDQYIIQYARAEQGFTGSGAFDAELDEVRRLAAAFPDKVRAVQEKWRRFLAERKAQGKKIAIWGGGSKGVSFLTSADFTAQVDQVIDINPYKQGKFVPGTGHEVLSPDQLPADPPDAVIVMNPIYVPEIRELLASKGLSPELVAV
ncbi:MAG: class I SAM-dependent methyltransferase [Pseudomonadota bacterium]